MLGSSEGIGMQEKQELEEFVALVKNEMPHRGQNRGKG